MAGGVEVCADCDSVNPRWSSVNRGVILCDECSTVHRQLGRHISQVKHLSRSRWRPSQLSLVRYLSGAGVNKYWEHVLLEPRSIPGRSNSTTTVPPTRSSKKPAPNDPVHPNKAEFIREKYLFLAFFKRPPGLRQDDLDQQLHASVRTGVVESSLYLLALGANANYRHPTRGNTPLHVACQYYQVGQAELLITYGADLNVKDAQGNTPIQVVEQSTSEGTSESRIELLECLVQCQYEVTDSLTYFLCRELPNHGSGTGYQHFLLPKLSGPTVKNTEGAAEAKRKLEYLSNPAFVDLCIDVYDEVDRRETNEVRRRMRGSGSRAGGSHHSTAGDPDSLLLFLPPNREYSSTRNQGRQKLGRLETAEFNTLVMDVLVEAKARMESGHLSGNFACMDSPSIMPYTNDAPISPSHAPVSPSTPADIMASPRPTRKLKQSESDTKPQRPPHASHKESAPHRSQSTKDVGHRDHSTKDKSHKDESAKVPNHKDQPVKVPNHRDQSAKVIANHRRRTRSSVDPFDDPVYDYVPLDSEYGSVFELTSSNKTPLVPPTNHSLSEPAPPPHVSVNPSVSQPDTPDGLVTEETAASSIHLRDLLNRVDDLEGRNKLLEARNKELEERGKRLERQMQTLQTEKEALLSAIPTGSVVSRSKVKHISPISSRSSSPTSSPAVAIVTNGKAPVSPAHAPALLSEGTVSDLRSTESTSTGSLIHELATSNGAVSRGEGVWTSGMIRRRQDLEGRKPDQQEQRKQSRREVKSGGLPEIRELERRERLQNNYSVGSECYNTGVLLRQEILQRSGVGGDRPPSVTGVPSKRGATPDMLARLTPATETTELENYVAPTSTGCSSPAPRLTSPPPRSDPALSPSPSRVPKTSTPVERDYDSPPDDEVSSMPSADRVVKGVDSVTIQIRSLLQVANDQSSGGDLLRCSRQIQGAVQSMIALFPPVCRRGQGAMGPILRSLSSHSRDLRRHCETHSGSIANWRAQPGEPMNTLIHHAHEIAKAAKLLLSLINNNKK